MNYYAGVGSRETPKHVCLLMRKTAAELAKLGWCLRSGGASGADEAFENGAFFGGGRTEIFLARSRPGHGVFLEGDVAVRATKIASEIHPAWHKCSPIGKLLHARNVAQVLGPDLETSSNCLVCWTPDGQDVGGTRTALVLARQRRVAVLNLGLVGLGTPAGGWTVDRIVAWVEKHRRSP